MLGNYTIRKKINAYIKECNEKQLYTLFESKYGKDVFKQKLSAETAKYFYDLLKEWDDRIAVPKTIGKQLESLVYNECISLGIHRTEIDSELSENSIMKSILENGLINNGDLMSSGAYSDIPSVNKTVSFPENILNTFILLKSTYKFSNGGFILAFPKNIVDKDGSTKCNDYNLLYNNINGVNYIKPEYIIGYIDNSYGVMNFYSREELLNNINNNSKVI